MQSARRRMAILIGAHILLGLLFLSAGYIRPDSVGLYCWLRSAVFDGDLLFFNEWHGFGMISDHLTRFKEVTPLGTLANHWWIGTALMSAPAYVAVALIGWLVGATSDGFFGIYAAVLSWSTVAFTCGTMAIALRLIEATSSISARSRIFVLAAVMFGTPLFWYTFRFPLSSHAAATLCIAAVLWLLLRTGRLESNAWAIGLIAGLAAATRIQHVVLFGAIVLSAWLQKASRRFYWKVAGAAILPLAAQAVAWWIVYGSPLGPITSGGNLAGLTWSQFHGRFIPVLFSSYHGLFAWAPLTLLGLIGWLAALRSPQRIAAITLLTLFAAEFLVNATLDRYFWGGLAFGPRRFVDLTAPFAVGIAWFLQSFRRRSAPLVLIAAATAWSIALTAAALAGTLNLERYVSTAEILDAIGSIFRSTNITLRSPITDAKLLLNSIAATALIALFAALLWALRRRWIAALSLYLAGCTVVLALLWIPTRSRAAGELARFTIDRDAASRWGPLVDQRKLLEDELDYLRATGNPSRASRTRGEIKRIDDILRTMNDE